MVEVNLEDTDNGVEDTDRGNMIEVVVEDFEISTLS